MRSTYSLLLVVIQFGCLIILGAGGPLILQNVYALVLQIISVIIGLWAVWVMNKSRLNIFPDVKTGAVLIEEGPYRVIRHPMYLAVLLFGLSLLLEYFTFFRLGVYMVLLVDLLIKMTYEEKLLRKEFTAYSVYCKRTRKIIPLIY